MSGRWADSRRRTHRAGTGWDEQAAARRILARDGHRCYLRSPVCIGHATEVDHIRPLGQGGTDTDDNKAAICVPCHRAKTAREASAGRAGRTRHRPPEPHPGLKDAS
jgi:5-methylcytosine-specific restriction protein A